MRLKKCVLSVSTCALISLLNPLPVSALGMAEISQVQDVTVKGKVTDSNGETIIGANVLEKGTTNGIITDMDGNFTLKVSSGAVLEISYIGYVTQTVKVTSQTNLNIVLKEDTETLDEVVVVGYGTMKKSDLTGSVVSVKAKELGYTSSSQTENALQGKVAGVSMITSGDPSEAAQVRVRGVASLNNSDPLYVVDGFPVSDIKNLTPQDIESMEVLKDASATAIYGSRGANGVILVTTKKGKEQKAIVNLDVNLGVNTPAFLPELCNASEYAELLLETGKFEGQSDKVSDLEKVISEKQQGTNWLDEITRPGFIQKYALSVRGGSEKDKYYISGSYSTNDGILNNTFYDKITLRFNNSYKINDWLTFDSNLSYLNEHKNWHNLHHEYGTFSRAMWIDPITPVYDEDGNYERAYYTYSDNPVRLINDAKNRDHNEHNFNGSFALKAEITKDLFFTTNYTIRYAFRERNDYNAAFYVSNEEKLDESYLQNDRYDSKDWMWNAILNYSKSINDHSLGVMGGFEIQETLWKNLSVTGYDVPSQDYLWYMSAAKSSDFAVNSSQAKVRLMSGFIRANYSYKNRYLLTATFRSDASSRFASNCRVGYFPSASLGWNVKEEEFMEKFSNIDLFKIRLGYGVTGNQNSAGYYDYIALMQNESVYGINGLPVNSVFPTKIVNKDLKWETVEMYNLGVDLGFWNNHFQVTADYYIKNTKDMILTQPIPIYTGAIAPTVNIGSIQNKGFELGLRLQDYGKPFKWNIGLNLSTVKNEVTSLGSQSVIEDGFIQKISGNLTRTEVGDEIGYYYGLKTDGIFKSQEEINSYVKDGELIQPNAEVGDLKFVDVNNDGIIDNLDRVKLGSAMPKLTAGFNVSLEYKGFDLNANFYSELGKELINSNIYWMQSSTMNENQNQYKYYYEQRYHPENNPNGTLPRMTSTDPNGNMKFSDMFVENANFLRLQNLQIGYNFPKRITSKMRMSNFRVYLSGDNLFLLTKYHGTDPEMVGFGGSATYAGIDRGQVYPRPRTFSFGINVSF